MLAAAAPLFSLVTVTRDNLAGLRATAESVARQRFHDFEWIVIDGASKDGTVDFLEQSSASLSFWSSEPDSGIYDAMNKGLERARGRYTIFLNAGDRLAAPDVLDHLAQAVFESAPDFLYGDALEDHAGRAVLKPARSHERLARGMFTHHQAMAYRTEALKALHYDLRYAVSADYDLTCRFLRVAPRALYVPRPLCVFEAGGVSQRRTALARAEQYRIRRALGLCGPLRNAAIYLMQCASLLLRRAAPGLYWRLRSCTICAPRFGSARLSPAAR